MKKTLILASLFLLALVGCKSSSDNALLSSQQQQSIFGWKPIYTETFETDALLQLKVFKLPASVGRLRVKVDASYAVFGGVFNEANVDAFKRTRHHMIERDFQSVPCSLQSVVKGQVACDVDASSQLYYIVRDRRDFGAVVAGGVGLWLRSHLMAEHATLPNKIRISFSIWQCLKNCPVLPAN